MSQSRRGMNWTAIGAVSAGIAVVCGALGSHALRSRLGPDLLRAWQVGTDYQLAHALALLIVAQLQLRPHGHSRYNPVGWLFLAGTILFSGSLYGLALTQWSVLGPITPLGGLCFIAGWALLAFRAFTAPSSEASNSTVIQQEERTQ